MGDNVSWLYTIAARFDDKINPNKNAEAFGQYFHYLDDRNLLLIIRDTNNDDRKDFKSLREHYLLPGKPRIIVLYTELTSLQKNLNENITDYAIQADNAATFLKNVGETISDELLIAMISKCLPKEYKAFSRVILNEESKFINFDKGFDSSRRILELAVTVHIDIVGPLPPAKSPNSSYISPYRYVLTCIDRTTRWVEAQPISEITASRVAEAFINTWATCWGVPLHVITDRGRQFESELFSEVAN